MLFIAAARCGPNLLTRRGRPKMTRINGAVLVFVAIVPLAAASGASAQTPPNPYRLVENWGQIPPNINGGKWGGVIGVQPGPDGSRWGARRCFNVVPAGPATRAGPGDVLPRLQ